MQYFRGVASKRLGRGLALYYRYLAENKSSQCALWCTVMCAYSPMAHAGAWPLPSNSGQIIQTNSITTASKSFDQNNQLSQTAQFSKQEAALFWEHGLSKDYTLILTSSYQDINFRAGVDDVAFSGFGETRIGLRKALLRTGPNIVSAQASIYFAGPGETITDADLGTGSTQYEARLLLGRSFKLGKKDGFADAQIAWRHRTGTAPDEWRVDVSTGWRPFEKIQILVQGFYVNSQIAPRLARKTERLKLQTSFVYDHSPRTSFQLGTYRTVAGKNIVQENAIFLSVWQRY